MTTRLSVIVAAALVSGLLIASAETKQPSATAPAAKDVAKDGIDARLTELAEAGTAYRAVEIYTLAKTRFDDQASLHRAFLQRIVRLGHPEMGAEAADRLLVLDAADPLGHVVIAYNHASAGKMMEAVAAVLPAIEKAPKDPFVMQTAAALTAWVEMQKDPGIAVGPLTTLNQYKLANQDQTLYANVYKQAREVYLARGDEPPAATQTARAPDGAVAATQPAGVAARPATEPVPPGEQVTGIPVPVPGEVVLPPGEAAPPTEQLVVREYLPPEPIYFPIFVPEPQPTFVRTVDTCGFCGFSHPFGFCPHSLISTNLFFGRHHFLGHSGFHDPFFFGGFHHRPFFHHRHPRNNVIIFNNGVPSAVVSGKGDVQIFPDINVGRNIVVDNNQIPNTGVLVDPNQLGRQDGLLIPNGSINSGRGSVNSGRGSVNSGGGDDGSRFVVPGSRGNSGRGSGGDARIDSSGRGSGSSGTTIRTDSSGRGSGSSTITRPDARTDSSGRGSGSSGAAIRTDSSGRGGSSTAVVRPGSSGRGSSDVRTAPAPTRSPVVIPRTDSSGRGSGSAVQPRGSSGSGSSGSSRTFVLPAQRSSSGSGSVAAPSRSGGSSPVIIRPQGSSSGRGSGDAVRSAPQVRSSPPTVIRSSPPVRSAPAVRSSGSGSSGRSFAPAPSAPRFSAPSSSGRGSAPAIRSSGSSGGRSMPAIRSSSGSSGRSAAPAIRSSGGGGRSSAISGGNRGSSGRGGGGGRGR